MYIKELKITSENKVIRNLQFQKGVNLIIDNTPENDGTKTGNNVGKTTVLKLIDFCLGGEETQIYKDEESEKKTVNNVQSFLQKNKVLISLILSDNLDNLNSRSIVIERDFINSNVIKINGEPKKTNDFKEYIRSLIFGKYDNSKRPSFREIISHNIRYKDERLSSTLKVLGKNSKLTNYEALYLFLFNCPYDKISIKGELELKLKKEKNFLEKLKNGYEKTNYEKSLIEEEEKIKILNNRKNFLINDEDVEFIFDKLRKINYKISSTNSELYNLQTRKKLILEAKKEMEADYSNLNLNEIKELYIFSKKYVPNLQKTFDDLVDYHNKMIVERINFLLEGLPELESDIKKSQNNLRKLISERENYTTKISKVDNIQELEKIINELNDSSEKKGMFKNILEQIDKSHTLIEDLENKLNEINQKMFSEEFNAKLKSQLNDFNDYFVKISKRLYDEKFYIDFVVKEIRKGVKVYDFKTTSYDLLGSGKKQGEILAFDLAYIKFADEKGMPCLHFLLNDKKELMHDNQLSKINEILSEFSINAQIIVSVLKDKIPNNLLNESNIVVELSQDNKLFRF